MIDKIARGIANHPKIVLIVCLILIIPAAFGYFNTFVNYDILSYLPEDLGSVQGEQILDNTFNNAASSIVVVKNEDQKTAADLKEKIQQIDGVNKVMWVDDIADITIPAEMLPDSIRDIFYSKDGTATLMMVQYSDGGASDSTMHAIKEIRHCLNKNMFMSGVSAIMYDTKEMADSQAPIYIAIAIVLALIVLSFTLNSWILPFVLLAALCTAVIYNMGTNFFLGGISFITQCIAAILQLGVTMDYSVFLMDRYEEERRHNDNKTEAMAKAISGTFVSLCGSSLTTIFGFLALCFMSFTLGLDIGLVMAKGVLLGVITVVTFLPALILLLDDKIEATRHKSVVPHFGKINEFTIKHRRPIAIIFLVLFIPAFFMSQNVKVYYNMDRALPQDLDSIVSLNEMKDTFNMATTHFIIVKEDMPASDYEKMTNDIKEVDGITNVISMSEFLGNALPKSMIPDDLLEICIKDGYQLMMVNTSFATATDEENAQVDIINNIVKSYDSGGYVTGEGAMTKDLVEVTNHDFLITSILSVAAIFILIAIIFKSVSVPFILVASIELAIFINESISFMTGSTISFVAPTIIGCVQLGATVDYAILLTTRFREELRKGLSKSEAIRKAANASDRSICQSALVFFAATFGVYLVCDIEIVKSICGLLARGSIISAIIIIFALTPILYICEGFINKTSFHWHVKPESSLEKYARKNAKKQAKTEAQK